MLTGSQLYGNKSHYGQVITYTIVLQKDAHERFKLHILQIGVWAFFYRIQL